MNLYIIQANIYVHALQGHILVLLTDALQKTVTFNLKKDSLLKSLFNHTLDFGNTFYINAHLFGLVFFPESISDISQTLSSTDGCCLTALFIYFLIFLFFLGHYHQERTMDQMIRLNF